MLFIVTVTVVLAPAGNVPVVDDKLTHGWSFTAVQEIELPPMFSSVYVLVDGLNGPPSFPDDVNPSSGVTERTPGLPV